MSEEKQPWTHEQFLAHEQALRDAHKHERNTHFQGAARLVYDEIEPLFRTMYEARLYRDTKQADDVEQLIRLTLARRDYDLVTYVLLHTPASFEIDGDISTIPDPTAWPKESE